MNILSQNTYLKELKNLATKEKVQIHLVGGFLRDYCLKKDGKDFDFAVESDALKLAQKFAKIIKGAFVLLDQEHDCARVVKKQKGEVFTYDFAGYRAKTFKEDLAHRDFTINTLSLDLNKYNDDDLQESIRDYKQAQKDIKSKKIKRVSLQALKEDPLRMVRAFSLKAQLGFTIEQSTLDQIKKEADAIRTVSSERVRDEFFKILESPRCAMTLNQMDKIGFLEKIIPQIQIMFNCHQGTYHHLDVWPHSMEVVVQFEKIVKELKDEEIISYLNEKIGGDHTRLAVTKLGCLLHDIGKPETRKKEKDRISFHGHEHVGKSITTHVAKLLKISTKERHALEDMVRWHLRPGYLSDLKVLTKKAKYRYFRDTKDEGASILLLSLADQRSTRGPATTERDQQNHEKICMKLIGEFFIKKKEKPLVRLLTGNDIMKATKIKPSPILGEIIDRIEEEQSLGKIKTKKEALQLAKTLASKK